MLSNKWVLFSLRRTAFLVMSLVLLTVLFAQFAVAAERNISVSGITFLDVNANEKLDPSEPPLQNYTIYIDTNSNSLYDLGENAQRTDKDGKYSFINITSSGIVRASSGDQFKPSSPGEGYDLNNVAAKENKFNFSYSMPKAADSVPIIYLHILMGLVAFAVILGGGIVLIKGLLGLNSPSNGDTKEDKKTIIQIVSGLILLLFFLFLNFGRKVFYLP